METLLWGAGLRFAQALVQAAPTILIGLIVAGVFRRLLGHEGTRRLFGENSARSLPRAWALGMLLPVCSLGVIPVVREMRRAGVAGGTILAFGLTAPLFNPISVLYGLTLADPIVILTFSFCSLVIVTLVGLGWDRLDRQPCEAEPEPPKVAFGLRRMLSIAVFGVKDLAGATSLYILCGLLGVAALSLILPPGYLQTAAEHDDPWAPLFMAGVAIPAYATPMTAMVQLASMFQHGNSVGAAFALLVLGAGANLGLLMWSVKSLGGPRTFAWFGLLLIIVLGLAYGVDKPLYPQGVEPAGHTHAFDIYCAPFYPGTIKASERAWHTLREKLAPHETVAIGLLGVGLLTGTGLRLFDRRDRLERWLQQPPTRQPRLDRELSGAVIGGAALAGLVVASIAGCYIYYPPPGEILAEMRIVNTEVASAAATRDWDTALYWIPIYEDWTRKLQVSMFLRGKPISPYRKAKMKVLQDKLEILEHEVEDEEIDEAREIGLQVARAYLRLSAAYRE